MAEAPKVRCHYDVLSVSRDAEPSAIKKAHRKLALKLHPDKNYGENAEAVADEFLLVQQAYECLMDPQERKWYDEHREMILRGGMFGEQADSNGEDILFDVTPFHFSGCFVGFGDGEGGFFQTYGMAVSKIWEGELSGWVSEGNIDETLMPNAHLPTNFGFGSSDWSEISQFYASWESFSSCLSFAWADKYDVREAESRWMRRRIEEENKKSRKIAKKKRNEDIVNLINFVKKLDPRVKAAQERAALEKVARKKDIEEDAKRKKEETKIAREAWRREREEEMMAEEANDLDAGRIRLADLNDSDDDYYGGGKRGKRKGKRGKRRGKNKSRWSDDEEEKQKDTTTQSQDSNAEIINRDSERQNNEEEEKSDHSIQVHDDTSINQEAQQLDDVDREHFGLEELESEYEESSSEEEEPEIFRCEICRKTFKSAQQLENHLKSKKHKEMVKKVQKRNK